MRKITTYAALLLAAPLLAAPVAAQDFEGTMRQVDVGLGVDALRSIAGSTDVDAILALDPERVLEAVHSGEVEATQIQRSTVLIDGPLTRMQAEGEAGYTIFDARDGVGYVVDPDERVVLVIDPEELAALAEEDGESSASEPPTAERIGTATIRGYRTTGYRVDLDDRILLAWLSPDLAEQIGSLSDALVELGNAMLAASRGDGGMTWPEQLASAGAAVRSVSLDTDMLASGGGGMMAQMMPAYSITEFYGVEAGPVDDARFALPDDYERQSMAEMLREMRQMMQEMRRERP